jgi:hypothetical protein
MAELTKEQVRDRLLDHVWGLVGYWSAQGGDVRARLAGLAFGILSALDGETTALPLFVVAANPHPVNQAYLAAQGEDLFPSVDVVPSTDIGGTLHDDFFERKPAGYGMLSEGLLPPAKPWP